MATASPDDRTARARIRDAAVFCFARDGFATPLRVIADRAGVSVPLITHHYRSKEALRRTCDDWVLDRFEELKLLAIQRPDSVRDTLDDAAASSVMTVYLVRSFLDATTAARSFYNRFLDHLRPVMASAEATGLVAPTTDPEARLAILAGHTIGVLMVQFAVDPPDDPETFVARAFSPDRLMAMMELYTQPLIQPSPAVDTYLDALRAHAADRDAPASQSGQSAGR
jgi:AcrR family transcriptional regulator